MHLLIVSATIAEIQPLTNYLNKFPFTISGLDKIFHIRQVDCRILITGAGLTQSAFHLGAILSKQVFDISVQAGICGAFNKTLNIGDVVQVVREEFAQTGAEDGETFLDLFELNLEDKNKFPFTDGKLLNTSKFNYAALKNLKSVNSVTVDTVHGNEKSIERTWKKYTPDIESMEGGSYFYGCLFYKIPCIQLRAVSNYVERRNKVNWNIPLAVEQLNLKLIELIEEISA